MKQAKQKKDFYKRVFARRKMLKDIKQEVTLILRKYYEENKEEIQLRNQRVQERWDKLLQENPEIANINVFAGNVDGEKK